MATSDRSARERALRYLGSTKNLVGCVLGLAGVVLWYSGVVGAAWPAVVAGLYLAGALAAPPEKVHLVDDAQSLREALTRLSGTAERLPSDLRPRLRHILDVLSSVLARPVELAADPEATHEVGRLLKTDVPLAVETYLNLPWWLTATRKTPAEELDTQLGLLARDAEATATRFFAKDLNQQSDHTRYLQDRAED